MELLGSGYVIDHCISAFLQRQDEKLYRFYVTDALKAIAGNTQLFAGGDSMSISYKEIIDRKPKEKEKTAEEIIDNLKSKLLKK